MPTIIADSTASTSSINALPPLAALQAPLRILKRPSPSSATPSQSDADAAEGLLRGLSLREREAQYHAARARIFGSGEELTSSPVLNDQDGMDGTSPELTSSVNVTPVLLVQASNSKEKVEGKYTSTGGPGRGDKTPEGGEEGTATIGSTLQVMSTAMSAASPPVAVGDGASLDLGSDSGSGQGARRGLDLGTPSGEDGVHHVQVLQGVPVPSAVSPRSPAPGRTKSGGEPAHAAVTVTVLRQPRGPSHPQQSQSQSQSQDQDQAQVQLKNASASQGANSVNGNSRGGGARGFGGRGRRRGGGKHGGSGHTTTPSQAQKQTQQSP